MALQSCISADLIWGVLFIIALTIVVVFIVSVVFDISDVSSFFSFINSRLCSFSLGAVPRLSAEVFAHNEHNP